MANTTDIKPAKACYTHLGGKPGTLLLDKFVEKGWLAKDKPTEKHFYITDKGQKEFTKPGINISQIKSEEP